MPSELRVFVSVVPIVSHHVPFLHGDETGEPCLPLSFPLKVTRTREGQDPTLAPPPSGPTAGESGSPRSWTGKANGANFLTRPPAAG